MGWLPDPLLASFPDRHEHMLCFLAETQLVAACVSAVKYVSCCQVLRSWSAVRVWAFLMPKLDCFSSSSVYVLLSTLWQRRRITVTICCPGPVATGSPDQPRSIYGGTGLVASHSRDSKKRMSPARVAELIGSATYHKLDECWIARHPVLLMGELFVQRPSGSYPPLPPNSLPPC